VVYSYSAGFNSAVTGKDVAAAPAAGGEWLAMATEPRRIPSALDRRSTFEGVGQSEFNEIVRSLRNTWSVDRETAKPSSSMSASVGGTDALFGQRVGYLASATYSFDQEVQRELVRAVALPGSEGRTLEASRYDGTLGRTSVLWGGLVNL